MRLSQRLIAAAVLMSLSGVLGGCGSLGNWDPTDLLDFLDTKKKLPGDRKPVFPEGVPGLEQGVPKELYKGRPRGSSTSRTPMQRSAASAAGRGAEIQAGRQEEAQAARERRRRPPTRIPMRRPPRMPPPPG